MFDTENISTRFAEINHRLMKKDDREIPLVDVRLEINPLTVALANELDTTLRGILFTRTDGEMASKIRRVSFDLPIKPQSIVVRAAKEIAKPTVSIDEAKIHGIYAQRDKKASAWVLCFTATIPDPSKEELAQLVNAYTKSYYLTFANAAPGLFDEEEKEERKKRASVVKGQKVSEAATLQ